MKSVTEPPPYSRGPRFDWDAVAKRARKKKNRGKWVVVEKAHLATATKIKRGELVAFRPAGSYDATCRNVGLDNRATLYVRYLGDPESA